MPPEEQQDPSLSVSIHISMRQLALIQWCVGNRSTNPGTVVFAEDSMGLAVNKYLQDSTFAVVDSLIMVNPRYCALILRGGVSSDVSDGLIKQLNSLLDKDWIYISCAMISSSAGRAHYLKLEGDPADQDCLESKLPNIVYLDGGQKYDKLMRQDLNFFSFKLFRRSLRGISKELFFTKPYQDEIAKQQELYLCSLERQSFEYGHWEFLATEYPNYQEFNRLQADSELFTGVSKGRLFIFSAPEKSKIPEGSCFAVLSVAIGKSPEDLLDDAALNYSVRESLEVDIQEELKRAALNKSVLESPLTQRGVQLLNAVDLLDSRVLNDLWLKLRKTYPDWIPSQPSKELREQYLEFREWLLDDQSRSGADDYPAFMSESGKLKTAISDLNTYCTRTDIFKDYVTKHPAILSFSHQGVLKYAEDKNVSLYVWKESGADEGGLTFVRSQEVENPTCAIHILEVEGGFHYLKSNTLSMGPQVEKDWLLSRSPPLTGTCEGESYAFEQVEMTGGGECVLSAIGVTPEQAVESLRLLSERHRRKFLAKEIKAAFQEKSITTERSTELLVCRKERWKFFVDLWRKSREKHPGWQPQPDDSQEIKVASFISWLQKNGCQDDAQNLLDQQLCFFRAEKELNFYCQQQDAFNAYLDFLSGSKLLLGSRISLLICSLYAMHANISVFIWKRINDKNDLVLNVSYKRSLPKEVVHILDMSDRFARLDLLVQRPDRIPLENLSNSLGTERIVNKINYIYVDQWFTY